MLFVIAVVLGIVLGIILPYNLTSDTLPYVAVAIIAALDSIFGGIVANYNKRFSNYVFMTGLISNAVLAVALTYVGNILGINLSFAAIVVFGVRIFNNLANIRRATIDRYFLKKAGVMPKDSYIGIEGGFDEKDEEAPSKTEDKSEEKTEEKTDSEEKLKESENSGETEKE